MTLGDRLRELREARGLSQSTLAGPGLSASYISLLESGRRSPTEAALERLAKRLNVSVSYLATGIETPPRVEIRSRIAFIRLAVESGDRVSARASAEAFDLESLEDSEDLRDEAAYELARAWELAGNLEAAAALLEPLATRCRHEVASVPTAGVHMLLCGIYLDAGDAVRAVEVAEMGLSASRRQGSMADPAVARLAATCVWAYLERGDSLYAALRAQELEQEVSTHGAHPASRGSLLWNVAIAQQRRGQHATALATMQQAIALLGEGHEGRDLTRAQIAHAELLLQLPQPRVDEAVALLVQAEGRLERHGASLDLATCRLALAHARLLGGVDEEAINLGREVVDALAGTNYRLVRVQAYVIIARSQLNCGYRVEALETLLSAKTELKMLPQTRQAAMIWVDIAQAETIAGLPSVADSHSRALIALGVLPSTSPALAPRRILRG